MFPLGWAEQKHRRTKLSKCSKDSVYYRKRCFTGGSYEFRFKALQKMHLSGVCINEHGRCKQLLYNTSVITTGVWELSCSVVSWWCKFTSSLVYLLLIIASVSFLLWSKGMHCTALLVKYISASHYPPHPAVWIFRYITVLWDVCINRH